MTAANWITLIVPLLGIVGGVLVYGLQKHIDRETEIKRERRQLYRNSAILLEKLNQQLRNNEPDKSAQLMALQELEITIAEVQVSCPDSVAEAWIRIPGLVSRLQAFQHRMDLMTDYHGFDEAIHAYEMGRANALSAMRFDTYGDTKMNMKRIVSVMAEMANIVRALS